MELVRPGKIKEGDTLIRPFGKRDQLVEVVSVNPARKVAGYLIDIFIPKQNELVTILRETKIRRVSTIDRETGDIKYR